MHRTFFRKEYSFGTEIFIDFSEEVHHFVEHSSVAANFFDHTKNHSHDGIFLGTLSELLNAPS